MTALTLKLKMAYWDVISGGPARRMKARALFSSMAVLKAVEGRLVNRGAVKARYAPVFIVGAPRSGSTLLYQLMARRFRVCYFSNLMMLFPESPVCVARALARVNGCDPPPSFESRYGETDGWKSPHQGQGIWLRWFRNDYGCMGPGELTEREGRELRNTVSLLQDAFRAPFLNKWQGHHGRLRVLAEVLPETLFIRIKRDPAWVAQSILYGRRTLFKDEREWFSSKPRNYEEIRLKPLLEQVCEQVYYLERDMDEDMEAIGREKFLEVNYEDFCRAPGEALEEIRRFYSRSQGLCELEGRHRISSSFECSGKIKIRQDEFEAIELIFSRLMGR